MCVATTILLTYVKLSTPHWLYGAFDTADSEQLKQSFLYNALGKWKSSFEIHVAKYHFTTSRRDAGIPDVKCHFWQHSEMDFVTLEFSEGSVRNDVVLLYTS